MNIIDENTKYYESTAHSYDSESAEDKWQANEILKEELGSLLSDVGDYLDLGSGTGKAIEAVRDICRPKRTTAVDSSPNMLKVLKAKLPGVNIVESDIGGFSESEPGQYDLITAMGVFELIPKLPRLLSKVNNLLNKGGLFAFTYEPLISNHDVQSERKSVYEIDTNGKNTQFTSFRWTPHEIKEVLGKKETEIMSERLFVGYERDEIPVIYSLIIAKS